MKLLEPETMNGVKLGVAALGAGLLLLEILLRRAGRPDRLKRLRDAGLAAAGLAAALCWWNLFQPHFDPPRSALGWVHFSDAFHYYMGPKYFRELGYFDLYECCAAAEQRLGDGEQVARRTYRDLESNVTVSGRTLLANARRCEARFEPARWQLFVHDVEWFRSRMPGWEGTMQDWGYNATPGWNLLGSWLAGAGPVSERRLALLSLLDVPCLLAMWALVAFSFGWRTMGVALIFWGTNLAAGSDWTGGSILRQEWLLASVAGVCLLHRQMPVAGGAAIAYATTLSIFPGFMALGIGLEALVGWWRERRVRLDAEQRGLLIGAVLALALVLPLAAQSAGGMRAWLDFAANIRTDMQPAPNNVGLPMLLSYDGDSRLRMLKLENRAAPARDWSEARKQTLERRTPLLFGILAAFLALFVAGTRRQPRFVVAILGLGFAVLALELSCYYYAFLLLFGLLWQRHAGIGLALCCVSVASYLIHERWRDAEEFSTWLSFVVVAFVIFATTTARFTQPRPPAPGVATPARLG